jgi:hypothetical protein
MAGHALMPRPSDDPTLPVDRRERRKVLTARRVARLRERREHPAEKPIAKLAELGRAGKLTAEHREKLAELLKDDRP